MIKYQNNTISRLYGGDTPAYILISGGTCVHGEYVQPSTSITINYTPVEWVSNEDISTRIWLDLGYVWKNNSRAQLGFVIPGTHQKPNGQQVFGEDTVWASDGNGPVDDNNDLRLFFTKSGSNIGAYWDVATSRIQSTIGAITDVWQDWEIGNNYIKNLSNNTNFVTGSTYSISRTGTVGLYGACQYLNTGRTDCVRYSYVKIYEDNKLIMDIIPVLDGNSIPCFFDKISQEFFYYKVNGEPSTGLTYGNAGEESGITINYSTELTTLTYDTPSGIIDTKTNLNASANTGVELIYSSDDTSIATVDASGVVAPKASGTTTITIIAPTKTIGNTTYRGVQKRLQIECDAPASTPAWDDDFLTIEALNPSTTITLKNPSDKNIWYRKDNQTEYTKIPEGNTSITIENANGYIKLYGDNGGVGGSRDNISFRIYCQNNCNCYGKLTSLLSSECPDTISNTYTITYTFSRLFYESRIVDAGGLVLPNNVSSNCYAYMFYGCTSLTTAPSLPSKRVAKSCYSNMFRSCSSLTQAPQLPATRLADNCYNYIFAYCSNLSTVNLYYAGSAQTSASLPFAYWLDDAGEDAGGTGCTIYAPADALWNASDSKMYIPSNWTVKKIL